MMISKSQSMAELGCINESINRGQAYAPYKLPAGRFAQIALVSAFIFFLSGFLYPASAGPASLAGRDLKAGNPFLSLSGL